MEDSHICAAALCDRDDMSLFGVFDGHGGAEVAQFCAKYFIRELVASETFKTGDFDNALKQAFHKMDMLLRDNSYSQEIAAVSCHQSGSKAACNVSFLLYLTQLVRLQLRLLTQNNEEARAESQGDENHTIVSQLREFKRMVIQSQVSESQVQLQAGCTAIVALKFHNALHVANAGDSRGVLCRSGTAHEGRMPDCPLGAGQIGVQTILHCGQME